MQKCQYNLIYTYRNLTFSIFPLLDTNLGHLLTETLLLPSLLMPFMKMTPRSHAQQTFSRNVRMNHKAKRIWKKKHILFKSRQLSTTYIWIRTHTCYIIHAECNVCIYYLTYLVQKYVYLSHLTIYSQYFWNIH